MGSQKQGTDFEAAAHRFMELGISKVTLDEIASDLRMSKKTMYKYFPSKEDLLKNIIHARIKRTENVLQISWFPRKAVRREVAGDIHVAGREFSAASKQFVADLRRFSPEL